MLPEWECVSLKGVANLCGSLLSAYALVGSKDGSLTLWNVPL